jgi:hypothetical protein
MSIVQPPSISRTFIDFLEQGGQARDLNFLPLFCLLAYQIPILYVFLENTLYCFKRSCCSSYSNYFYVVLVQYCSTISMYCSSIKFSVVPVLKQLYCSEKKLFVPPGKFSSLSFCSSCSSYQN